MKNKVLGAAGAVKGLAKNNLDKIDVDMIKDSVNNIREKANDTKDAVSDKIHELDIMLEDAIVDYNTEFTKLNDAGMNLYIQRSVAVEVVENVETLVNSIANVPKEFVSDFEEVKVSRESFRNAEAFAKDELENARKSASQAGAGLAAGGAVVSMAPTAAMWIATTFGTASTGTAISALSGAAATNAALAWLGGGTLAAGAGGVARGQALLALAGPVGMGIAGASLLVSIALFSKNKIKTNKAKNEEIEAVKKNTESIKEDTAKINNIMAETVTLRDNLKEQFSKNMDLFGMDYSQMEINDRKRLAAMVMNTHSLSALFQKTVE